MTVLRLADCGDTLTPKEVWTLLQMSRSLYYEQVRHSTFPIKPLPGLDVVRYSKASVEAYLASPKLPSSLRRVS